MPITLKKFTCVNSHAEFLGRNGKEGTAEPRSSVRSKASPRDKVMWGSLWNSQSVSWWVSEERHLMTASVGVWEHWGKGKLLRRSNFYSALYYICFYSILLFKAHPLVDPGSQDCLQDWERPVLPEELLGDSGRKHWWENHRSRGWWWAGVSRMVLGEWMWGTADCCWTQLSAFWPCSQQGLWQPYPGPLPVGRSCQGFVRVFEGGFKRQNTLSFVSPFYGPI